MMSIEEARRAAPRIFKKYGWDGSQRVRSLGSGAFGHAWLLPSGTVAKITSDPSEAALAALLEGRHPRGFPDVHAVREFASGGFVIFREFVYTNLKPVARQNIERAARLAQQEPLPIDVDGWVGDLATAIQTIRSIGGTPDMTSGNLGVLKDGSAVFLDLGHGAEYSGNVRRAQ